MCLRGRILSFPISSKPLRLKEVIAGEWFGWSVKLQLLDRDGLTECWHSCASALCRRAESQQCRWSTSGVGYVQVFTVVAGSAGEAGRFKPLRRLLSQLLMCAPLGIV